MIKSEIKNVLFTTAAEREDLSRNHFILFNLNHQVVVISNIDEHFIHRHFLIKKAEKKTEEKKSRLTMLILCCEILL